jgi:hypothetical protein
MTELAQEQKATPPEVIMGHVKRSTNGGDIIFINTELVTPKVIDIMVASINEMVEIVNSAGEPSLEGHGLYSVVFRDDGRPRVEQDKLTPWLFVPDSKSAVCNLADCVELAFINTMDEDKGDAVYCNVAHVFWKHLITGFFHEAHHAEAFITDYDELIDDEDARQVEEFKADEFADLHSFHMAKLVNMEPEFSPRVAEMLNGLLTKNSSLKTKMRMIMPNSGCRFKSKCNDQAQASSCQHPKEQVKRISIVTPSKSSCAMCVLKTWTVLIGI